MAELRITGSISIDEAELAEHFVQASGPGGQNVNKVATAVQLRFDARRSRALPDDVAVRLMKLAGRRLTQDGVIVIDARRHRSQERNRADARERLAELIRRAVEPPVKRRPTKPTLASKKRRLDSKSARGRTKQARARPVLD